MDTINIKLKTIDDKAMFSATARDNPELIIDYFPPVGTGNGYTSLELLMASFASCVSTTILSLLRHKMQKTVDGISINVNGTVRERHPKALEHMHVDLNIKANNLSEDDVQHALKISEESFCPVWSMIKGNVTIDFDVSIS
ncbi:OsmC family protein [Breznakia pachnodae]|uniref:Redox protein n=1 Tax=Breznakia pachnodae TaxID=265178 RepID=A0ABU0E0U3_9FIRM|nr:OsmC family protein [Breznakia pachnodae]MDQ0360446.1 putative redox protein [Breznakia pachnodae]